MTGEKLQICLYLTEFDVCIDSHSSENCSILGEGGQLIGFVYRYSDSPSGRPYRVWVIAQTNFQSQAWEIKKTLKKETKLKKKQSKRIDDKLQTNQNYHPSDDLLRPSPVQ